MPYPPFTKTAIARSVETLFAQMLDAWIKQLREKT